MKTQFDLRSFESIKGFIAITNKTIIGTHHITEIKNIINECESYAFVYHDNTITVFHKPEILIIEADELHGFFSKNIKSLNEMLEAFMKDVKYMHEENISNNDSMNKSLSYFTPSKKNMINAYSKLDSNFLITLTNLQKVKDDREKKINNIKTQMDKFEKQYS